jgi:ribonuclease J
MRILPLDGANTIGGSKIFVEDDEFRVMLDFGTNFHELNKYYEEYLKPRPNCGILDYLEMGILPDVRNIYRDDLLHAGVRLEGPEIERLDAVLISHAHVDHMGALGFIDYKVPVITTLMSATIMKAMQDSGNFEPGSDGVYAKLREPVECHGNVVLNTRNGIMPGRDFEIADCKPTDEFEEFWRFHPSSLKKAARKSLEPGKLLAHQCGVKYRACPVDHSIKGACGFILEGTNGSIVYTGDIRLHGIHGEKTEEFVRNARTADPAVLIIEGTSIGRASNEFVSESDVQSHARQLISEMEHELVISDFGPRNIERLEIFKSIAVEFDRQIVVTSKDAYLLHAMHIADPTVPEPGEDIRIYNSPRSRYDNWEEWTLFERYPDHCVNPSDIRDSPGSYILAFSFWDMKNLIDIKPEKGHYIYSSSEAHSEEQEIDFKRLQNWLTRFNIKKYGFDFDVYGKPTFPKGLHASGHASEEDLAKIIERIEPETIIPVHTEHPEWFVENFQGTYKIVIPEKMKWIEI